MAEFAQGPATYARVSVRIDEVFNSIQGFVVRQQGQAAFATSRWRDDAMLHQALNNIKAASQAWAMSCSKLALLISKSPSPEALTSLLEEMLSNIDVVLVVYMQLVDCSLSKPLFGMVSLSLRSQLFHSKEFMEFVSSPSPDYGSISNAAGVIFKMYDQVQDLPMTNKAAYRRFVMEQLTVVKDTMREFQGYVDAAAVGSDGATTTVNQAEEVDEDDDEDDEPYTPHEASVVQICLGSMDCTMQSLKAVLVIMTHVADALTPASTSASTSDAQDRTACESWVGDLCDLVKACENQVTDLGAELYSPFDMSNIRRYNTALCETLGVITRHLSDSRFLPHLNHAHRQQLSELETCHLAVELASRTRLD